MTHCVWLCVVQVQGLGDINPSTENVEGVAVDGGGKGTAAAERQGCRGACLHGSHTAAPLGQAVC